ncbi:hypothetical protein BOX15_Mlig017318g2 [Macrostomum lignano]|uniref:Uncharacterized protein n=1 Tax=Macrostomum lignano TaxID=282301 RepID=A0A267EPJ3_9PLAT|nr:hypothetical protein BOX15_Mlig017318g2 [Macrostomum lignano]
MRFKLSNSFFLGVSAIRKNDVLARQSQPSSVCTSKLSALWAFGVPSGSPDMPKPSDNNKKRKKAREVEELLLQLGIKNSSNEPSTGTRLPQGIKELLSKLSTQRLDQLEYAKLEELALQIRRFMQWRDDSASLSSRADSREDGEPDEALLRATRSLHRAAESGDLESCQMALRRVPSVDCQDAYGLTALHCAARNGQSEIASRLLSEGASINAQDQDGNTPLMLATVNQQPHLLRLLTDRGADLVVKNRQGFTAADLAFAAHDLQSLAILEEKQLALQFDAAVHNETIPELVRSHATECVRYWLENYPKRDAEKPCDLQYKDEQTIAHVASQIGSTEFLHLVAEQDGNFDKIDNTNSSPLFYAAQQGSEEIAELLLSKGCNVNRVCNLGRTPLFSAVMNSHIEFVKMLLRAGANVHLKDGMGKCPLAYCIESENQEIFDCVLDAMKSTDQFECETQSNLIQLAAELSRVQMLKQLHQASMPLDIPRAKDGRTAVMAACHAGTAETVAYLAENNCDVNRIDRAGNTPALLAAANGQLSVLNVLKSHQANFDVPNSEGKTAILVAAGSKDNALETVKFLLDQGCKINVIDNKGNTVASQATSALNWPLIKLLIEKKVPMDIADNKGNTPLMKAITAQSEDGSLTRKIVIALIGYGCSSTVKNNKGNSALSMAAKMGRVDLLTHFAASGKPIMNINRKGKTILMQVAAKNQVDVIRYLHRDSPEENDNKNATDECGRTAVHFAAMKGHPEAIVYLVNNLKCVFDTKDKYGLTLFLLAVREGNEDVVKKLADYGADVNLRNNQGENAVHMATQMRFFDMVKLLERKDCCLDQEDKTGKTPLMIACSNNDSSIVDFLLSRNVLLEPCTKENRQAIHFACEAGGLEVLQKLVEKNVSICCIDSAGITSLMLAALAGSRETVKILLTTVPDLNFVTAKDNYGKTALEYAIIGQNSELLSDLISAGCDVNNRKSNGWTPLLIAIEVGKAAADSMVQILIANGCSKDTETEDGLSAAHLACRCNKLEILKVLIEKKFPIDTVTKSGDSCLTLAAAKASAELVGLLIDFGLEKRHTNNDGDSAVSIACLRGDEDVLSKIWPITDEDSVKVYSLKNTLLHFACKGGSKKIAKSLIEKNESLLHARNGDFETPLHVACRNLKLDIVELLLEYGADPNAIDGNGKTPIFGALSASKGFEICQLLLAKSADVNVVSKDGVSVLAEAFFRGSRSIIDLLLQTGARLSADTLSPNFEVFRTNIRSRKNKNLTELLDLGVPVDRRESQWNLLHLAIETCRSSLINELLSRGASVTVKDAKGYTPLLTAIRFGQIDLAREILRKHPESKNDVNNNKNTLLHVAVSESKLSTLRWLLSEFDFLKDAKNCYEETALHLAARIGNEEMYQLLVEKGWNPQLAVRDGRSMLELAARSGNSRFAVTMHLRNHSDSVCESLFCHLASTGQAAALRSLQRREFVRNSQGKFVML